jgi:hypothetical protein
MGAKQNIYLIVQIVAMKYQKLYSPYQVQKLDVTIARVINCAAMKSACFVTKNCLHHMKRVKNGHILIQKT